MYNKSTLIYDLETSGLNTNTDKIRRFGFYSYKSQKVHIIYPKDVKNAKFLLKVHKTLIGFNNNDFDDQFLISNNIRFFPTANLDLKIIIEKRQSIMKKRFDKFSLNHICKVLGLGEKEDTPLELLQKEPENCTPEENKIIDDYLRQDILLTKALYEYVEKEFEPLKTMLTIEDNEKYGYITFAPSTYAYKVICQMAGLNEIYGERTGDEEYQGATVLEPTTEKEIGSIILLDFKSAYPHAYMMQNLYNRAKKEEIMQGKYYSGNKLYKLQGKYSIKEMGKIERVIQTLYKLRNKYKENKDPREYAIKIILNIFYGISGNPVFTSVYNIDTASDCTKTVRSWLAYAKKEFEIAGYRVLYGDTDSVFIFDHLKDKEKACIIRDKIINDIKAMVPFPQDTFKMEVEKDIKAMFFFPHKKKDRLEKKNYMYIDIEDNIIIKGLPVIKLTAAPLSRNIFEKLKPQIIEKLDCKFEKDYIEQIIKDRISKKGISIISRTFRVFPGKEYKSSTSIQSQIIKKYGYGVHFLIKNNKIGVGKGVKYCSIDEATKHKMKYDDLNLKNVWSELQPFIKVKKMVTLNKWM